MAAPSPQQLQPASDFFKLPPNLANGIDEKNNWLEIKRQAEKLMLRWILLKYVAMQKHDSKKIRREMLTIENCLTLFQSLAHFISSIAAAADARTFSPQLTPTEDTECRKIGKEHGQLVRRVLNLRDTTMGKMRSKNVWREMCAIKYCILVCRSMIALFLARK